MTTTTVAIYSTSVLTAQGAKLTADQRAMLAARAERLREMIGTTDKMSVGVPVIDPYTNATIGHVAYSL